ncbi:class E sortase [Brevibacterium rongguiense]|nr:class E sortase [Brevibacterium rongguiense]
MDQPMSRRERIAQERAAQEAQRGGTPASAADAAEPASGRPPVGRQSAVQPTAGEAAARGEQLSGEQSRGGRRGAEHFSAEQVSNEQSGGEPPTERFDPIGGGQGSAARPVIRSAQPTGQQAALGQGYGTGGRAYAGSAPHAPAQHPNAAAPSGPPAGGQAHPQSAQYGWPTAAAPAAADYSARTQPWAGQQQAQPAAPAVAGSTSAAGAGDSGAGGGSRNREYEPLGPVRGTIRAFGELCITAGLVLILFVVWQLWWTDFAADNDNQKLADQLTTQWKDNPKDELPDDPDEPVVGKAPEAEKAFGIVYIPRFGDDYYRTLAEGVSLDPVLNNMGLGHYPSTAMPGDVGNFALAGHRVTYGKPLNQIAEMRPGDKIIVQTADGYYTYTFRNFDIVLPDDTDVLSPVPAYPKYKGKDRIMTMTACNPMFSARERYIAYSELTDWRPASKGAPSDIKDSPAFADAGGK